MIFIDKFHNIIFRLSLQKKWLIPAVKFICSNIKIVDKKNFNDILSAIKLGWKCIPSFFKTIKNNFWGPSGDYGWHLIIKLMSTGKIHYYIWNKVGILTTGTKFFSTVLFTLRLLVLKLLYNFWLLILKLFSILDLRLITKNLYRKSIFTCDER